jgi:hypothetical protein
MGAKMTVIVPPKLDAKRLIRGLRNGMKNASENVIVDFMTTTKTWKHQPEFKATEVSAAEWIISTDDSVWSMLDDGTKPHIIRPKRAKRLRFQWGGQGSYKAKTRPGYLGSNKGRVSGPIVFRKQVRHPGTKPRKWTDAAKVKWDRELGDIVQRAIDAEVSNMGRNI